MATLSSKGKNAAKPPSQMTIVDDDTLDTISKVIESLISLKSRTPLANMVLNNVIASDEDNNPLEIKNENTKPPAVLTNFSSHKISDLIVFHTWTRCRK